MHGDNHLSPSEIDCMCLAEVMAATHELPDPKKPPPNLTPLGNPDEMRRFAAQVRKRSLREQFEAARLG